MKTTFLIATVLLASLPAFAGTDSKDMKDVKAVAPVSASDAGFYVAAEGGVQFATGYGNKGQVLSGTGTGTFPPGHTEVFSDSEIHSPGYDAVGGVRVGYNFESIRTTDWLSLQPAVEFEALYIGNNTTADGNFNNPFPRANVPTHSDGHIQSNSADFFVNGILRLKNKSIVTPYFGLGVGGQYINTSASTTVTSGAGGASINNLNSNDLDFAFQALGGFDVAITRHFSLFTEYKFIDALGTDAKSDAYGFGLTYRFKPDQLQQNLVVAGLKYTF
jgi:opacity protein-like surface antigen